MWRDLAWVLYMLQASRKAIEYARGLNEEQFQAGYHETLGGNRGEPHYANRHPSDAIFQSH